VIKSIRMRWTGHVACVRKGEAYTEFWWGNLRERYHLVDPDVDGRIILRWVFRKLRNHLGYPDVDGRIILRWIFRKLRYHLGDPDVDGRIILRWIFRKLGCGGVDWIELAQDGDRWRELVNAVMNIRVVP
jgi:hypothetical protein